jgi:L-fuconate dehydratase
VPGVSSPGTPSTLAKHTTEIPVAVTINEVLVRDVRFPTSVTLDGSDALNTEPDYSAAYVILRTDAGDGLEGHGLTFTTGRGNELCVAAVGSLAHLVRGRTLEEIAADLGAFWSRLVSDGQLRWVGPEKGVIHLATAALVNAVWDLLAKRAGKPLWRYLADMTPEEIVRAVPFRHITDDLTREEALDILRRLEPTKAMRIAQLRATGYPAYTTSSGWLGYPDAKVRRLAREGVAAGWTHFKLKVGLDLASDVRRAAIMREEIGEDGILMVDANQAWDVDQAIEAMQALAPSRPMWIEEPTSPDDILGHARIARALEPLGIRVATGEHCHNRVMFKQFLQADAIGFCQIDSCRLGGVNEVLAVLLLAAKHGVPVCPHAGGVGLCEYVQHLAIFDFVAVSGSLDERVVEYVDHLHEHFVDPVVIRDGRYVVPEAPGYSITMQPASLERFAYPDGAAWSGSRDRDAADAGASVSGVRS